MEKGAAGYPSLPLHSGLTNPGISRDLASRLPNFLGLKAREVMSETHLEDQLLDKLQEFLLELGHGFCFEARQKRILIGDSYFFIDLVF
jgi:predicted nuclease of restriction endonuclease-like (RecB) superfamily